MGERVKTDGEVEIPLHKWYEIADKLSRVDDLIALLNKQVDLGNELLKKIVSILLTLSGLPVPPGEVTQPITVISVPVYRNKYFVHELDLATAHTDKVLEFDKTVTSVTVVQCDAACTWKRNAVGNSSEPLSLGYSIDDFIVDRLFITNVAAAAGSKLKILTEWKE